MGALELKPEFQTLTLVDTAKVNYSTDSFRYPCLVTTSSLSLTLPWYFTNGSASGISSSLDVMGSEYKTQGSIHRDMMIHDY